MSQLIDIIRVINRNALFRGQVPMEWQLSFPLPDRTADELIWRCFLYPRAGINAPQRAIGRPRALLSMSADGQRIVDYDENDRASRLPPGPDPAGVTPDPSVKDWPRTQLRDAKVAALTAIGQLSDQEWSEAPDATAAAALNAARGTILESGLLPYYDAIAPEFWAWASGRGGGAG
jgi:hypothetical protein